MHQHPGKWPGTWRAICDVCAFEFPSDMLKERWDGFMVCEKDFETKQPQLDIKVRPEQIAPPWTRPEPVEVFRNVCTVIGSSNYTGLAVADCARADNSSLPYSFLLQLNNNQEIYV